MKPPLWRLLGFYFSPRTGEASSPTVHTGLKPLEQPPGWCSKVSHLNVWKASGASFNWFIMGAEAPCITLDSLEKEYLGSLPGGQNPCGKGKHASRRPVTVNMVGARQAELLICLHPVIAEFWRNGPGPPQISGTAISSTEKALWGRGEEREVVFLQRVLASLHSLWCLSVKLCDWLTHDWESSCKATGYKGNYIRSLAQAFIYSIGSK